jgi:hypothetical protein
MAEIIKLKHPIDFNEKRIEAVTVGRPKGRDMIALAPHLPALVAFAEQSEAGGKALPGKEAFEAMVAIAGILTGIGIEAAGELDFEDIGAIVEASSGFLEAALGDGAPANGGTSSG